MSTTLFAFLLNRLTIFTGVFLNEGACHAEDTND